MNAVTPSSSKGTTLKEILDRTIEHFKSRNIESARLDAEILLSQALNLKRIDLYLKFDYPLSPSELSACRELVMRRAKGEPTAYIVGSRGFYKSDFLVGPGVLIPRPETELIVETVVDWVKKSRAKNKNQDPSPSQSDSPTLTIVDFGCGSGCIGLSCLVDLPDARLVGVDISDVAITTSVRNAEKLSLTSRADFVLAPVESFNCDSAFDVVVANPPYIGSNDPVEEMVKKYEPHVALFSEDDGYLALKTWAKVAEKYLRPGGLCVFEIGSNQGEKMREFFVDLGVFSSVEIKKDYARHDRMIVATKR